MANTREINMTEGKLFPKLVVFAIPLIFSGILQLLYNAADLIVCGRFGSIHATAAISSTNPLINLIINLFLGLSVGANVLMSRCYGAEDREKGQRVVYTSMIYALFFGIAIGLFGFFASKPLLILMKVPEELLELSSAYLKIYFTGLPFSMLYNFGASLLRATGDTKRPFLFLAVSGIFNVGLNLLFVIVFQMDVPGVAVATVIAQGISALLILVCLFRSKGFFRFSLKEIRFYRREAVEIAAIGLPAGIQGVIFSLSNVLIQSSVNSLGTDVMDGNGASSSLEGFIYTAMNSVAQASVAFVSANYGARKKNNIKKVIFSSLLLVLFMNILVGGAILLLRVPLIGLYVHTEEAFEAATARLLVIALTYFLCGFMDTLAYGLRGIGYSVTPTVISLVGACGFRIFWIFVFFPLPLFHSIVGLAISYPISWILTSAVHLIFLVKNFKKINFGKKDEA
ncbi:MAG: MATE family efflux transporter [Clostridia bacterium]|nr:MATE family efflux transporter [Clostridia bacterium]